MVVLATGMMLLVAVAAVLISTDARPSALLESAADLVSAHYRDCLLTSWTPFPLQEKKQAAGGALLIPI